MKSKVELFLEDISFNTKYEFLDIAKNKEELQKVAKKCRIRFPSHDLAIFKGTYAYVDRQNKNGCTLPKEEVAKALDTLIGKAVDFDHFRKRVVGHWLDAEIEDDKIIAYGAFFKGNFEDDYDDIKKMMEKDKLGISFEAWGCKEMKTADTYNLNDIEFAGGALLIQEDPAYDGAEVLEMSKKRVLEFASVMKKPKSFIRSEEEKIEIEDVKVEEEKEDAALPPEVTSCVARKTKAGMSPAQAVKECWAEFKKQNKGQDEEGIGELPEEARIYLSDLQSILGQLFDVECPSCKQKSGKRILIIDLENSSVKIKCMACDAVLKVDFTPKIKLVKKGRTIKEVKIAEDEKAKEIKEKDWLEIFETSEDSDDVLEEAFMNEVEYDDNKVKLNEDAKQLTYKERQQISDKMFAVVKIVKSKVTGKPRKIRMFPIHDPAHVRNALARLSQARETLKKLGVSIDTVKRKILKRARELNMKDLLERYEKSTVEEQAKLFQEIVEVQTKLKTDIEARDTEITTMKDEAAKKDEEMTTLKAELETVKKEAEEVKAEIAKRDKEVRDAEIAKRREELGDLAKDMSDDDIMNDDKFKISKLEKENIELKAKVEKADKDKDPENASHKDDTDLDKGSKDKDKQNETFAAQKRVDEKAFGTDKK